MYPYSPHSTYTTSLIAGRLWQILFSVLGCRARCSINLLAGMNIALPPLNLPYSLLTVFAEGFCLGYSLRAMMLSSALAQKIFSCPSLNYQAGNLQSPLSNEPFLHTHIISAISVIVMTWTQSKLSNVLYVHKFTVLKIFVILLT